MGPGDPAGALWRFVLTLVLAGCEMFVDDVGGDGQPCFETYHCTGDLVCNFNTCTPPLSENDDCDPDRNVARSCGNELVCLNGTCTAPGAEGDPCSANHDRSDYDYYGDFNYEGLQVGTCEASLYCVNGVCARYGGKNEPCIPRRSSWENPCEGDLECIDDVCVPVGGEGQPCNPDAYDVQDECDNGLGCFDGACVSPLPDEVLQPELGLYWKRCIAGTDWDGWRCVFEYSDDTEWEWLDARAQCPSGYRLPSRTEVVSLFSNCDLDVETSDSSGWYDPCEESDVCSALFDQLHSERWTSTRSPDTISDYYWSVDFGTGYVTESFDFEHHSVQCVRDAD
jgi:hypothetical protein